MIVYVKERCKCGRRVFYGAMSTDIEIELPECDEDCAKRAEDG